MSIENPRQRRQRIEAWQDYKQVPIPASVVYRTGRPTFHDYREAIESLQRAAKQLEPNGNYCAVCGDSDHQAWECHHNPLVMARRGAQKEREWRCFHCGMVFTQDELDKIRL